MSLLLLSLCVLPCSASDVDIEVSPTLTELAQSNELDLVVPYASGDPVTMSVSSVVNGKVTVTLTDGSGSSGQTLTLKNVPWTSGHFGGDGYWVPAGGSIDFASLSSSDSPWTDTLVTQLMSNVKGIQGFLGTGSSDSVLYYISQIAPRLTQDGGSVAYWVRQIQLLTAQIQGYLQTGIPGFDGHLLDIYNLIDNISYLPGHSPFLSASGDVISYSGRISFLDLVAHGFQGLNTRFTQFSNWLSGSDTFSPSFSLDIVDSYDDNGNPVMKTENYTSLASFLSGFGTSLETPLKMLQDVLATSEDIKLREQEAENKKEFTDNFTGDGDAAASKDDISDASDLTSGIKDTFGGNSVSVSDAFSAASDDSLFSFFSQATHDSLNSVNSPVMYSQFDDFDFWSDFVVDEDGFYSLRDKSSWSISDYLREED